jgi:ABC-2 type transport system permease protein
MRRWWSCYATATRFALIEHARNRLAIVIVLFFIPVWITLAYASTSPTPVPFILRPVGHSVLVAGNSLAQIIGALQVIALIVGFMMFMATARSTLFDRRLVQIGYPRLSLVLAKMTSLLVAGGGVAVYTTLWLQLYWRPKQLVLLATSLFIVALVYGGIGIMLASVLRSELAGMFLLIMGSAIDLGLQNPVAIPVGGSNLLRALPGYGPMQCAVTSVALNLVPWNYLVVGLCWAAGTATTGIAGFVLRTRSRRTGAIDSADPADPADPDELRNSHAHTRRTQAGPRRHPTAQRVVAGVDQGPTQRHAP